jgi:hypothetical protein
VIAFHSPPCGIRALGLEEQVHLTLVIRFIVPPVQDALSEGPGVAAREPRHCIQIGIARRADQLKQARELVGERALEFVFARPDVAGSGRLGTHAEQRVPGNGEFWLSRHQPNAQRVLQPQRVTGVPENVVGQTRRGPQQLRGLCEIEYLQRLAPNVGRKCLQAIRSWNHVRTPLFVPTKTCTAAAPRNTVPKKD